MDILKEVQEERDHQDKKWGGPNHDDDHGPYAWVSFIINYLGKSVSEFITDDSTLPYRVESRLRNFRYNMIKIAALAVAAAESADRKLKTLPTQTVIFGRRPVIPFKNELGKESSDP